MAKKNDINDEIPDIKEIHQYQRISPEDWQGNNAAFFCPCCKRSFLVSTMKNIHNKKRVCPRCTGTIKCRGICTGSMNKGGYAFAYLFNSKEENNDNNKS